jgi:2-keto-3-deoxy-L-rhamnonate aldolase RhmA
MPEHRARSAERTVVIAQIEDVEALDAIQEIAAVPDIDALFIGRIDLTVALGCESPDDPPVEQAVERIVAACVAAGRPVGMFLPRAGDVSHWVERGATLFLLGSDHGFLRQGAQALRRATGIAGSS